MNSLQFQAFEIFKKHSFSAEEAEAVIEYMKEAKSDSLAQKKDLAKWCCCSGSVAKTRFVWYQSYKTQNILKLQETHSCKFIRMGAGFIRGGYIP